MKTKPKDERDINDPRVHPLIRRHHLITQGVSKEKADAFVQEAATALMTLAMRVPMTRLQLEPAPARPKIAELLSQASHNVRQMCPHDKRSTEEAA